MGKLKAIDIRKMSDDERQNRIEETKNEITTQKALVASGGALENPGNMKLLKRQLARLLTIQAEIDRLKS